MNVTATNKATGDVLNLPVNTTSEVIIAWRFAQEYEKTAKTLKDQLKKVIPSYADEHGLSETHKGYHFRVSNVQRMNYDKAVMREIITDADTFDLLVKPDKTAIDGWLKEIVAYGVDGDISTKLRASMVPDGMPYQVIKLEKVTRKD